jgi:DNA-binding NarL/FixJ family response regulator
MHDPAVTRVLVVDDDQGAEPSLAPLLEGEPSVRLLGTAVDADAALRFDDGDDGGPDLFLVTLDHVGRAVQATATIRDAEPLARIVLMPIGTGEATATEIADAIAAGACGYVPLEQAREDLADICRRAAAGELVLPERDLGALLARLEEIRSDPPERDALERLTTRETEILRSLAEGRTAAEIADALGISALTVQSHLKSTLAKLGVHSKIEAVTLAWRHGLAPATRTA